MAVVLIAAGMFPSQMRADSALFFAAHNHDAAVHPDHVEAGAVRAERDWLVITWSVVPAAQRPLATYRTRSVTGTTGLIS